MTTITATNSIVSAWNLDTMALSIIRQPRNETMPQAEVKHSSLEEFLKDIERRAFQMARMASGNQADALDIVQDSMFALVEKYSDKSPNEWKPLFYRILNSKITDYYRRKSVRDKVLGWTSWLHRNEDETDSDPFENVAGAPHEAPHEMLEREQRIEKLSAAVSELPARQREAFMLRCWEGMSTAETAASMKCTEGSVKTHYSRALHTLRDLLEGY